MTFRYAFPRLFVPAILVLMLVVAGCSKTRINYFGDSYGSVPTVDVYYAKGDVKRPFRVMGKATGTADRGGSTEKLHEKFVAKAKEKGADGVIFFEIKRDVSANVSTTGSSGFSWKRLFFGSSATRSTKEYGYVVEAEFIKYTDVD